MDKILMLAALAEAGTGVILLAYPPIVVRLLFDAEIVGAGITMSRLAGIALIGLGVACWPGTDTRWALTGMVTYSGLAMLYLSGSVFTEKSLGCYCGRQSWSMRSLSFFSSARFKEKKMPAGLEPELTIAFHDWRQLMNEVSTVAKAQPAIEHSRLHRVAGSVGCRSFLLPCR